MDHVDKYRRPKDESGNEIIEKGCAPKTPTPSPTPSPVMSPEPVKEKPLKKKKASKDKRKKRTIKKKYEYSDSDEHSFLGGKMSNTKFSDKQSKRAKDDNGCSKEKRGRTWARGDVSPLPKRMSASSTSESIQRIGRKRSTSTPQSRQSYRDSVSRSRSRSRDRNRRMRHNEEHSRSTADRKHSKARDWSEPREIESSKKQFDRSGKAKRTHI